MRDPGNTSGRYRIQPVKAREKKLPFLFPQKKRKAKRKLPADVRKLKNICAVRGKRTRRERFTASIRQALQLSIPQPIHPGSNIFSPHTSLSVILLIAFFHRPDGFALRSFRTPMRNSGIPGRGIPPATSAWAPHHVRGGMGGLPKPPMHWITLYSMQNVFLLWGSGVGDFYFKRERRV